MNEKKKKEDENFQDECIAYNPDPLDIFKMFAAATLAFILVSAVLGLGIIQVVRFIAKPVSKFARRKSK